MRNTLGVLALLLTCAVAGAGRREGERPMGPDTALLVIDIQNFYFEGGLVPLTGSVEAGEQAKRVLDAFRAKRLPVMHVRHVPKSVAIVDGEPADPAVPDPPGRGAGRPGRRSSASATRTASARRTCSSTCRRTASGNW